MFIYNLSLSYQHITIAPAMIVATDPKANETASEDFLTGVLDETGAFTGADTGAATGASTGVSTTGASDMGTSATGASMGAARSVPKIHVN